MAGDTGRENVSWVLTEDAALPDVSLLLSYL
jgi:hypothetical protein